MEYRISSGETLVLVVFGRGRGHLASNPDPERSGGAPTSAPTAPTWGRSSVARGIR